MSGINGIKVSGACALAAGLLFTGVAETETGTKDDPIRSVTALTNRLQKANETYYKSTRATTLYIAPGKYDVGECAMIPYFDGKIQTDAGYKSHLAVAGYTLSGTTTNPRDVVIYDGKRNSRVFLLSKAGLKYLTVSNACWSGNTGGGVRATGAVSYNVIITDCQANSSGAGTNGGNWYNSEFLNNNSVVGMGGGVCGGYYENCIISNNTAVKFGGGAYYGSKMVNCRVIGNKAGIAGGGICGLHGNSSKCTMEGGELAYNEALGTTEAPAGDVKKGTVSGDGGGSWSCTLTKGVKVHHNKAKNAGGGAFARSFISISTDSKGKTTNDSFTNEVNDCIFYENEAVVGGGGALLTNYCRMVDCVVSNNVVDARGHKLLKVCGGGVLMGCDNSTLKPWVQDSRICFNRVWNDAEASADSSAACGAGICGGSATNCIIDGNAVMNGGSPTKQGGGAYDSWLYECYVYNNVLVQNSLGTGLNGGAAWHCVFSNNVNTSSGSDCWVIRQTNNNPVDGCTIRDGGVTSVRMRNCRLDGCSNYVYIAKGANCITNGWFKNNTPVLGGFIYATNCLITGAYQPDNVLMYRNSSLGGHLLLNCTIAGNRYNALFGIKDSLNPSRPVVFENCLIVDNVDENGEPRNLYSYKWSHGKYAALTNNVIGPGRMCVVSNGCEVGTVNITNARFVGGDGPDRYELRYGSPARGKGVVRGWMTAAHDIRDSEEYPRLRDGKVDAGCYQCWRYPEGLYMIVK